MKSKKITKIDKKDYFRAVLTDTAPSDVPIIFSNDGLYINHHKAELDKVKIFSVVRSLYINIISPVDKIGADLADAMKDQVKQSYPLKYKIIKSETSLRTLSLIHPRSQKNHCEFYREYSSIITSLCSRSPFSIRAPAKVGGSFYSSDADTLNRYKEINIDTLESELKRKHASSYFSYRGYNRLYKLYNSPRYLMLEQKFSSMWTLDVASCFQSIYTHTISWAIKNKEFVKDNLSYTSQFCQKFDTLIQRSNNNETNGVPVGSEVSRVFAEIILQDVDVKIMHELSRLKLKHEDDYEILRYVDDYIVFSHSSEVSEVINNTITDAIGAYNLSVNDSKLIKYDRPFCTDKSKAIVGVKELLDKFEDTLIRKVRVKDKYYSCPNSIFNSDKFIQSFINKVKVLINDSRRGYSDISAYVVSMLCRRVEDIIRSNAYDVPHTPEKDLVFRDAILIILRLIFFFYSVSPTVSSSNKISKTLIVADQFIKNNKPNSLEFFRTEIMCHVNRLKFQRQKHDIRNGYISLERLNILLATSEFGSNHLMDPKVFSYLNENEVNVTYFDIVSLLYYFKGHTIYEEARNSLINIAVSRINSKPNLQQDSEQAHIFLDLICCPYLSRDLRRDLLGGYLLTYEPARHFTFEMVEAFISELEGGFWFVKWKNLNLVRLLERKELKPIY
jgi:hypothetical protein